MAAVQIWLTKTVRYTAFLRSRLHLPRTSASAAPLLLAACLSGCAMGPDFQRPALPADAGLSPQPLPATTTATPQQAAGAAQHFDAKQTIPADWWTLFQSPALNALIDAALKNNPGIESAQAALRQSQQYLAAQEGFFYPTVGVSYSPSRNKLAGNMGGNSPGIQGNGRLIQTYANPAGPKFNGPAYYSFHTAQLSLNYIPDVFGLNRRQVESLEAQKNMQRYQLEASYLTLTANLVAAALQEASLRAQIEAAERIVELNRQTLNILQQQLARGFVAEMDVAGQEAALAQAEQALIPLRAQLHQTRNLLNALAGNLPSQPLTQTFHLSDLHLPEALPLSLPSQLVEQRPDIRAAEEQFHAASAAVGVAVASRIPQFSLTAGIGGMAATPDWMFRAGGGFFNIVGNVSQALFDGGTLKAREQAAREGLLQAAADYRSTVITAFQNVADTLYVIQSDADALQAADKSEQAQKRTFEISRRQYERGFISYQLLLLAEQSYQQAIISRIQAQTNRLGDTAALYQALGGGWWNRTEATSHTDDPTRQRAGDIHAEAKP